MTIWRKNARICVFKMLTGDGQESELWVSGRRHVHLPIAGKIGWHYDEYSAFVLT